MAQFRHMGFTFDGIAGASLGYYLINPTTDNGGVVGLNKTIKEEDTGKSIKQFNGVTYNTLEFDIHICKMNDDHSKILEINENDMFFLNNWLMKPKTYRVFTNYPMEWEYGYETCVSRDICYYCMFTSMTDVRVNDLTGYVTLHMKLNSGFAYSPIIHNQYTVATSQTINIYTRSNVDEFVYPDLKIYPTTAGTVTVKNNTTGETMTLQNLKANHVYYCYNEDLKRIIEYSSNDNYLNNKPTTRNMQPEFITKQWLSLVYGENSITITGDCSIDIIYQNKLAIQR